MENQIEEFRDIEGYEGLYQVSNLGRVKSLSRIKTKSNGVKQVIKESILKGGLDGRGYLKVDLYKDKSKTEPIHKLVSIAFLNHKPNGFNLVVNHIDHNRLNNVYTNLEVITQRENANKKHVISSSTLIGASWDKSRNKWMSQIVINKKNKYLGRFNTEKEAHEAYLNKLKEIN